VIKIRAQAWSMDITLAVIIFIASFFVIYAIATNRTSTSTEELTQEAERISKEAASENSSLSIVESNQLDQIKVEDLIGQDYEEIKKKLRIENEFCIYIEDKDGNLIYLNQSETENITGIGSPDITIGGNPCS